MNADIRGTYFDGKTARARDVHVSTHADTLVLTGDDFIEKHAFSTFGATDGLGSAARTLTFANGASVTVADGLALSNLLKGSDHAETFAAKAPRKTLWVLASVVMFIAVCAAGYQWGVPWAARHIAHALPAPAINAISASSLDLLETMGVGESKLPAARQAELIAAFNALRPPEGNTRAKQILFRASPEHGANAVALPDGTMVVTDELVKLAQNNDQILGVMCHELGHVAHRHGAQMVVQGTLVAAFLGMYLGDFSTVVTGAAATLVTSHYSRDAERESDDYAAAMLKANGKSPKVLADMLRRMDHAYRAEQKKAGDAASAAGKTRDLSDYFSSHPGTAERIARLEAAAK